MKLHEASGEYTKLVAQPVAQEITAKTTREKQPEREELEELRKIG